MTMPPRHIHSVSSIHDPPEFKFILPLLPPSTLFFIKLHPLNVCQYSSKSTHRALNVGFIHRFGMCFFQTASPEYVFLSQKQKNMLVYFIFLLLFSSKCTVWRPLSLPMIIYRTTVGKII